MSLKNTGTETLLAISRANSFNKWMYQTIKPFIKGNVLEIGSGIGNISVYFLEDKHLISLSDNQTEYVKYLKEKFSSYYNLKEIINLDIEHPNFETLYFSKKGNYDTVVLLNVIEHLKNDQQTIKNAEFLLTPGGKIVILTPAYPFLYSSLDRSLGHYRRYTKTNIKKLLEISNYTVTTVFYFNSLGIVAWLYGKLLRLKKIPSGEMIIYNKIVPIVKLMDRLFLKKIGLSIIMIAQKKE